MDEDDDDDDIVFNAAGGHSKAVHLKEDNPDAEFEGEFGYALLKALRGGSVGRRLKRNLFKFGCFQLICNFELLMITIQACKSPLRSRQDVVPCCFASNILTPFTLAPCNREEFPRYGILRYAEIRVSSAGAM